MKKADLGLAIKIASNAHYGQYDKGGNPYILHPLKVMNYCKSVDVEVKMIAILHDVVEDTNITLEDLIARGFSERVIAGVDAMTKREGECFEDYVKRLLDNNDAIIVKMGDLRDNTDVRRLRGLSQKDFKRMEKYQCLYEQLKAFRIKHNF